MSISTIYSNIGIARRNDPDWPPALGTSSSYVLVVGEGNPARAVQVGREALAKIPALNEDVRGSYWNLFSHLIRALCRQDRFAEATAMLEEQGRRLKTHGGSEMDQFSLLAEAGAVLARSGRAREALPILEAVATNRLSDAENWKFAMGVAVNSGDRASHERLSRICWLRFGSTVEGNAALQVLVGLYLQPMDERTLAMARVLMERVEDGSFVPDLHGNMVNAMLTYREHRYPEALRLLDQFIDTPSSRLGSRFVYDPPQQAIALALRAMLGAELGRAEEARRDLAQSLAQLKLALGDKPGHDRGDLWFLVDQAEILQREAKALFQAKGIPLPEPDSK